MPSRGRSRSGGQRVRRATVNRKRTATANQRRRSNSAGNGMRNTVKSTVKEKDKDLAKDKVKDMAKDKAKDMTKKTLNKSVGALMRSSLLLSALPIAAFAYVMGSAGRREKTIVKHHYHNKENSGYAESSPQEEDDVVDLHEDDPCFDTFRSMTQCFTDNGESNCSEFVDAFVTCTKQNSVEV